MPNIAEQATTTSRNHPMMGHGKAGRERLNAAATRIFASAPSGYNAVARRLSSQHERVLARHSGNSWKSAASQIESTGLAERRSGTT
jgi:hypothetical protein